MHKSHAIHLLKWYVFLNSNELELTSWSFLVDPLVCLDVNWYVFLMKLQFGFIPEHAAHLKATRIPSNGKIVVSRFGAWQKLNDKTWTYIIIPILEAPPPKSVYWLHVLHDKNSNAPPSCSSRPLGVHIGCTFIGEILDVGSVKSSSREAYSSLSLLMTAVMRNLYGMLMILMLNCTTMWNAHI